MILIDTHALVWWQESSARLSSKALSVITREAHHGTLVISAFSFWEIALLIEHNRLALSSNLSDWIAKVEAKKRTRFVPVDNRIAVASVQLPAGLHKDPADRIIVATAMLLDIPVVTADRQLRAYSHIRTIW